MLQVVSLFPQKLLAKPPCLEHKTSQLILLIMKEKNIRTSEIKLRCYPEEKKKIQYLSHTYGLNMSEYILKKAMDQPVKANYKEIVQHIHALNIELSRIGNNINQLAKTANSQIKTGHVHQNIWLGYRNQIEKLYQMKWDLNKEIKKLIKIMIK